MQAHRCQLAAPEQVYFCPHEATGSSWCIKEMPSQAWVVDSTSSLHDTLLSLHVAEPVLVGGLLPVRWRRLLESGATLQVHHLLQQLPVNYIP